MDRKESDQVLFDEKDSYRIHIIRRILLEFLLLLHHAVNTCNKDKRSAGSQKIEADSLIYITVFLDLCDVIPQIVVFRGSSDS